MEHRTSRSSVESRLERMLASEGLERLRSGGIWTVVSLVALAPLLVLLSGLPDAFYYHGFLILFMLSVWLEYLCARRWPKVDSFHYAFVAANLALLSFMLVYPNPLSLLSESDYAASLMLRTNNFIFFFLILASLTFSFSPRLLLWGGFCGAVFWSLANWWVMTQPNVEVFELRIEFAEQGLQGGQMEEAWHPRYVHADIWIQQVTALLVVASLLALVVQGSRQLLLRRAIEERRGANLARYLPAQMADRMAETDEPFLQDREAEAAVLFTDIVGFTRWSESRSPPQVMALLRDVHSLVTEEVFRAEGVLDKFIGDGAMATFGVAKTKGAPAARALDCAEAILARMELYNGERRTRGEASVQVSVGVHYGLVTIGDVGAEGRLEMAVLGDTVNVASRLEALTRVLAVEAVVSDKVMQAAGGPRPGWVRSGDHTLPGRAGAVAIWTRDRPSAQTAREEQANVTQQDGSTVRSDYP